MMFVRNQWYGAIWSRNLGDEPVGLRVLDKPIVLFRTADRAVAALDDMCPHRFVPLRLGTIVDGERLRCGYHGLEFDRVGACVHNPHTNGRIPPAAKVKSYTAEERHGMVWMWLGDRPADPDLIPDLSMLEGAQPKWDAARRYSVTQFRFSLVIKANYALVAENLLDLSHACVLHDGLLGNAEATDSEISIEETNDGFAVKRLASNVPPAKLLDLLYPDNRGLVDTWADMQLIGATCLMNDVGATAPGKGRTGGSGLYAAHLLTPVNEDTTLYHTGAALTDPPERSIEENLAFNQQVGELAGYAFSEQDKVVLEAQQAAISDKALNTSRPAMFDIDIGSTHYARRIKALLEADVAV